MHVAAWIYPTGCACMQIFRMVMSRKVGAAVVYYGLSIVCCASLSPIASFTFTSVS